MIVKPTGYPEEMKDRAEQEWRAYDDYYSTQTLDHPYFYHHERREGAFLDALISKYRIPRGARVVDMGCGNGFHANLFQQRGMRVTAVDMSDKAIAYCRGKYGASCEWLCSDAFELHRDDQFDVGFCFWFMYFNAFDVPSDGAEAARRLMKVIKPGGRMFFIWHSDLTAVRLPPDRFSVMNYTIPQLGKFFRDYPIETFAVDSPAISCQLLGRHAFNKYVTRLSCARVYMQASNWKRARLVIVVNKQGL
jgi:SAM-dependent methyltransferase